MQKLIYIYCLFLFINQSVVAQRLVLPDTIILHQVQESTIRKNEAFNRLFLIYLYEKYAGYVVYKNAPFKGFSFDLNNPLFQNRFFNQVTFGLGAFTWDFKETGLNKVGGVFLNHPLYMGWEFTLYNQFRLQPEQLYWNKGFYLTILKEPS